MFTSKKIFSYFAYAVIVLGVVFRIIIYFQNRDLIIDEANVARNVFERDFAGLAKPLYYEQFAPPVFLWITKVNTILLGMSEYALRLFPLICGCIALIQCYWLMKKMGVRYALWYPLFLMATGWIYVRYSTEVKQYASDCVVALSLILLALKTDLIKARSFSFLLTWILAGSIAIWSSMPSVFILAGVGIYYFFSAIQSRQFSKIFRIILPGLIWLTQFYFYYTLILKPQAHSDFLQNSHKTNFLILLPKTGEEWAYNAASLNTLLTAIGGKWALSITLHLVTFFTGIVLLFKKRKTEIFLFIVPLLALLFTAGLHDFSLLPRVSLFIMPLFLVVIGVGLEFYLGIRFTPVKIVFLICCAIALVNFNELKSIVKPMEFDRITKSYKWISARKTKEKVYVHDLVMPQNIYYTSIHPDSNKWAFMKSAVYFYWNTNMDSLCNSIQGNCFFVYGWLEDWDWKRSADAIPKYFNATDSLINETNKTYYLERK